MQETLTGYVKPIVYALISQKLKTTKHNLINHRNNESSLPTLVNTNCSTDTWIHRYYSEYMQICCTQSAHYCYYFENKMASQISQKYLQTVKITQIYPLFKIPRCTLSTFNNLFFCKIMMLRHLFFYNRRQCSYEVKRDVTESRHCIYPRTPVHFHSARLHCATLRSCSLGHRCSKSWGRRVAP